MRQMDEYAMVVQKAKNGGFGRVLQDFFQEHKDGVIDISYVTLRCEKCYDLARRMRLDMYVPNGRMSESEENDQPSGDTTYNIDKCVSYDQLCDYYTKYAEFKHMCNKCRGRMTYMKGKMRCPKCWILLEERWPILCD